MVVIDPISLRVVVVTGDRRAVAIVIVDPVRTILTTASTLSTPRVRRASVLSVLLSHF
jgi:hypothetical protein